MGIEGELDFRGDLQIHRQHRKGDQQLIAHQFLVGDPEFVHEAVNSTPKREGAIAEVRVLSLRLDTRAPSTMNFVLQRRN